MLSAKKIPVVAMTLKPEPADANHFQVYVAWAEPVLGTSGTTSVLIEDFLYGERGLKPRIAIRVSSLMKEIRKRRKRLKSSQQLTITVSYPTREPLQIL